MGLRYLHDSFALNRLCCMMKCLLMKLSVPFQYSLTAITVPSRLPGASLQYSKQLMEGAQIALADTISHSLIGWAAALKKIITKSETTYIPVLL